MSQTDVERNRSSLHVLDLQLWGYRNEATEGKEQYSDSFLFLG